MIKPLHDRVLVRRSDEVEEATASGIFIPETAKEKPLKGIVAAVGLGRKTDEGNRIPLDVEIGDEILFGKYAGVEVKIEGQDFLVMSESDIFGVLEPDK